VFRFTSDQAGIGQAKDRIKAHLLELWLYKDDPAVLLRAQGRVVLHSFAYLGYSLVPLAVMLAPVALVLVQLESRFAWRAIEPGESVIVVASTAAPFAAAPPATLESPTGLVAETSALRITDRGQVLWRVRADRPGEHSVHLAVGASAVRSRVVVGTRSALGPITYRADDWRSLGYPAEPALDAGAQVTSVEVEYPRARGEFLGLSSASWLLFAFTLLFGFALRGPLGVTF
jgi:hypothetical protein